MNGICITGGSGTGKSFSFIVEHDLKMPILLVDHQFDDIPASYIDYFSDGTYLFHFCFGFEHTSIIAFVILVQLMASRQYRQWMT